MAPPIGHESRPPRVGYVLKRFPRLSETFILNELLELERQGVPVEVFALMEPTDEVRHEALKGLQARITYLPHDSTLKTWRIKERRYSEGALRERAFKELIREEELPEDDLLSFKAAALAMLARSRGIGHLHAHFATSATTLAMLASRVGDLPYSFTAHAKDIYDASVDPARLAEKMRRARFVVTVSDYNRRYLAELAGDDARKIVRLYNGIDLVRFQPDPSSRREPDLILGVGRLVEKKGFRHLIEACHHLQDRGRSFRCLIVGEGPEYDSLARQIATFGLWDRVSLLGAQPQERVLEALKRATVLVLPCVVSSTGDRDGLPTVLIEALATGLPAISTTVSGVPEIIEHRRTGLLVPPGDPRYLAEAIEEVLGDAGFRESMQRQGRSKAESTFDVQRNVRVLRDLFAGSQVGREQPLEPATC